MPVSMKHEREQCDHEIKAWVTPSLYDRIERDAANEGRSISNMTRRLLERVYAERQESAA
jgi:hypothetical protein